MTRIKIKIDGMDEILADVPEVPKTGDTITLVDNERDPVKVTVSSVNHVVSKDKDSDGHNIELGCVY